MVSIIIATFNASKTITNALESVINQSFQDWECIVVDGASKDNTIDIVKGYIDKDKRFRYISEPDNGIYDAFNKGWKIAKGEWIYYLGSDDYLKSNSFNDFPFDCENDVAIISGAVERISKIGKHRISIPHGFEGSHQGQITRREVIKQMNGFDLSYKIVGDFDLNTRIELSGYKVLNLHSIVAVFNGGGTSEQFKNLFKTTKERYMVFCKNPKYKYPLIEAIYSYVINIMYIIYAKIYSFIVNSNK